MTRPSNHANSGYSGMILNFPSSPRNWNSRSWLEIICLAPSITLGRGPSKVLSFTMFRRRPVSILLPSKRMTLTRAHGMNCVGFLANRRTPALVRCPSTSIPLLLSICS